MVWGLRWSGWRTNRDRRAWLNTDLPASAGLFFWAKCLEKRVQKRVQTSKALVEFHDLQAL